MASEAMKSAPRGLGAPKDEREREAARAKPLVMWIAREITRAEFGEYVIIERQLGLIYTNGRDERAVKDAQIIISKRARCSLSKIELIEFDSQPWADQISAIQAEQHRVTLLMGEAAQRLQSAKSAR